MPADGRRAAAQTFVVRRPRSPSAIREALAPGLVDATEGCAGSASVETAIGAVDRRGQPPAPTLARRHVRRKGDSVQNSVYCRPPDVPIDTQHDVCEAPLVLKTKRTYNLSRRTIETVQALAERQIAPTQDALVELAVDELARHVREADEAETWAAAVADPEFAAEVADIDAVYRDGDAESWPRP
jgi:hypothetical protein